MEGGLQGDEDLSRESGTRPREKDTLGAQGVTRLVLWSRGAWVEETRREGGEMEKGRKSQEEGIRW